MAPHRESKYTVNQRISDLQARVLALETENKTLRTWVLGELATMVNDARNIIQGQIHIPVDGKDGRDGVSITGPRGEKGDAGDVLVIPNSELAKTVLALRRKLKERHAAVLATLIEHIEGNRRDSSSSSARILSRHLETIKQEIERLG
jgi:hypothetical protein